MFSALLAFSSTGLLSLSWCQTLLVTLILTHVTIVSVTVYLHRCQAHRTLELHQVASHFFRFWLWMTTGIQTGPWTAVHRKHHAKCETTDDPHSPRTSGIWTVILRGSELYTVEAQNEETLRRFGRGTPDDWIERNFYVKYPNLGISLLMVIDVALFGIVGVSVWAVQMMWIPFWAGGVINGAGHFWGYRNFGTVDASTNIIPLGILVGGEELHNNHHAYATSAKLSNRWYEVDIGWMYISLLSAAGLAKIKKTAPTPRLVKGKAIADNDTLQAVLRNRCEVMARYAEASERVFRQEQEETPHINRRERFIQIRAVRSLFRGEWIAHGDGSLTCLPTVVQGNPQLRTCIKLCIELSALWDRSNASREQLLLQLQEWCEHAERSGLSALAEFSSRLRQYI